MVVGWGVVVNLIQITLMWCSNSGQIALSFFKIDLPFLIYINDLTDNISSKIKLFADDSSLFVRVTDVDTAHRLLSEDLEKITQWANQWKMVFNPRHNQTGC